MKGPYKEEWKGAAIKELTSLKKNNTQSIIPKDKMPARRRLLDGKWVLKTKRDSASSIARFKARYVIRGFMQQEGVNYDEIFATIVKSATQKLILALAAKYDLKIE